MFVANTNTGKSITIQTKTMLNALVRSKKGETYWKWRVAKSPPMAHESYFYAFVDLRDDPSQTPDVFIVPSGELVSPLLEAYPEGVDPESPEAKDVWCVIYEKDAPKYQNRWDIIEDALA